MLSFTGWCVSYTLYPRIARKAIPFHEIVQTGVPINPAISESVRMNDAGRFTGAPVAIKAPVRANAGIGLAVASVLVQKVAPDLICRP